MKPCCRLACIAIGSFPAALFSNLTTGITIIICASYYDKQMCSITKLNFYAVNSAFIIFNLLYSQFIFKYLISKYPIE